MHIDGETMPSATGQPLTQPIYRRPVSSLQHEPSFTSRKMSYRRKIIDSGEGENNHDEDIRAAKSRRIEKAEEAYLSGDPMSILTTSIRGSPARTPRRVILEAARPSCLAGDNGYPDWC